MQNQLNASPGNDGPARRWQAGLLPLLAVVLCLFAAWVAIHFRGQPLLEAHAFRQTQTALTAYWFKDGFKLAYETPVGGYPWAVPFEFPLYQWLVAQVAELAGFSMDATGRVVSFIFLLACVWPVVRLKQLLALNDDFPWIFICLFFSAPIYLFWGRTFMIETAALFFAVAFIPYSIALQRNPESVRGAVLAGLFITLGLLQKITTGLPVLAILGGCYVYAQLTRQEKLQSRFRAAICFAIAYAVPLLIAALWSHFTDEVKAKNPLGQHLTSAALTQWNFGTFGQRLSPGLWAGVIWERMLVPTAGGLIGIFVLGWALCTRGATALRKYLCVALALFVMPLFVFTNLHYVHNYYQTAVAIFLIGGLAAAISVLKPAGRLTHFPLLLTAILVISNLIHFHNGYWKNIVLPLTEKNNRTLAIARVLRDHTAEHSAFIAYGYDWSSELAYYAQRKSFTVPAFVADYETILTSPRQHLGSMSLGAVVLCPSARPLSERQVNQCVAEEQLVRAARVADCVVFLKDAAPDGGTIGL